MSRDLILQVHNHHSELHVRSLSLFHVSQRRRWGTPSQESGEFNLSYLMQAAHDVGEVLKGSKNKIIVTELSKEAGSPVLIEKMNITWMTD